jgi:phosphoribosylformylglycinamidine cyclo-ligase
VDIDAGEAVVAGIRAAVARTHGPRVLGGLGHFGGFYRIGQAGPGATLVASTDSVGTKLKLAILAGRHRGIGFDLVHHCVNDILACGATPLFFLDYYATGRLHPDHAIEVIGAIADACAAHGIALIGGETAELPGLYAGDDYDIAGFIVGLVQEHGIIDGSRVRAGDVIIGLPSSGFHTNGYSLIRAVLGLNRDGGDARAILDAPAPADPTGRTLGDALLEPHRSYAAEVRELLLAGVVHGMAHITGGGLPGNVSRIVPAGLVACIDTRAWSVPPLFEYVALAGDVDRRECYRAFNMGIGYVIVVDATQVETALGIAHDGIVIGQIARDEGAERVTLLGIGAQA